MEYSSYRLGSQSVARSRFGRLKLSVTKSVWVVHTSDTYWSHRLTEHSNSTAPQRFAPVRRGVSSQAGRLLLWSFVPHLVQLSTYAGFLAP